MTIKELCFREIDPPYKRSLCLTDTHSKTSARRRKGERRKYPIKHYHTLGSGKKSNIGEEELNVPKIMRRKELGTSTESQV